jgi:Cof subfamily protein (haloacid dehalogenase superfamily)
LSASSGRVRLLALDIDGTLLNSRKEISPRNHAAIASAQAMGVRLALITGRRYPAARRIAELLTGDPALVLHNGSLVVENAIPIRVRPLSRFTAAAVVRFGRSQGADPVVHFGYRGEGLLYVETTTPSHTLLAYYLDRSHPDVRVVPDLEATLLAESQDPLQVMFGGAMEEMKKLALGIAGAGFPAQTLRTVYPSDDLSLIDVVAPGVDKSEALEFLCDRFQIGINESLAIGDNWNDRSMLLAAGLGCVMANADPDLRSLGLHEVPGNDEDGVACAIERFILGSE